MTCSVNNVVIRDLGSHLRKMKQVLINTPGDGHCFLGSLKSCLKYDYDNIVDKEQIMNQIMEELIDNIDHYQEYLTSDESLLESAADFFENKTWNQNVVDVIIGATCNTFYIDLYLYTAIDAQTYIIFKHPSVKQPAAPVYMRYTGSHYDSVVRYSSETEKIFRPFENNPCDQVYSTVKSTEELKKRIDDLVEEYEYARMYDIDDYPEDNTQEKEEEPTNWDVEDDRDVEIINVEAPRSPRKAMQPPYKTSDLYIWPQEVHHNARKWQFRWQQNWDLFFKTPVQEVYEVPHEIQGTSRYRVKLNGRNFNDVVRDGRYWRLRENSHHSKHSGFVRKTGKCLGNFVCNNPVCNKYKMTGVPNTSNFVNQSFCKVCSTCGEVALRVKCTGRKVVEYQSGVDYVEVYYEGGHQCTTQPNIRSAVTSIQNELKANSHLTTKEATNEVIIRKLQTGDTTGAQEVAKHFSHTRVVASLKEKVRTSVAGPNTNTDSFEALSIVKDTTDTMDEFLLYKFNNKLASTTGGYPSFVFKMGRTVAELVLKMDQRCHHNPMQKEFLYVDAMHTRSTNFKTLTMWVYHPGIAEMLQVAVMEVENENEENIKLFYNIFHEVLRAVKGDNSFVLRPRGIYVDEAGPNKRAAVQVFGEYIRGKIVTCQWHFLRCARMHRNDVSAEEQDYFILLCKKLIRSKTKLECQKHLEDLYAMAGRNPRIRTWVHWWNARKFHIVDAFRGFNVGGLNLAEVGHSSMKRKEPLSLVQGAWLDCARMILQKEKLEGWAKNSIKLMKRGKRATNYIRQKRHLREQCHAATQYAKILSSNSIKEIEAELLLYEGDSDFMPSIDATHKAPKHQDVDMANPTQSMQADMETYMEIDEEFDEEEMEEIRLVIEEDDDKVSHAQQHQQNRKQSNPRKTRPKVVCTPPPTKKSKQEKICSKMLTRTKTGTLNTVHRCIGCLDDCKKEKEKPTVKAPLPKRKRKGTQHIPTKHLTTNLFENPPTITFFKPSITTCQGCEWPINAKNYRKPRNLILSLKMRRRYPNKDGVWVEGNRYTTGYFHYHRDLGCIKKVVPTVESEDLYMSGEDFARIDFAHILELRRRGVYDHITENRRIVREAKRKHRT